MRKLLNPVIVIINCTILATIPDVLHSKFYVLSLGGTLDSIVGSFNLEPIPMLSINNLSMMCTEGHRLLRKWLILLPSRFSDNTTAASS